MIQIDDHRASNAGEASSATRVDRSNDGMRVEIFRSIDEFRKIRPAWDVFFREHAETCAYMHDPALVLADLTANTPDVQPFFLVVYRGDDICCIAPFYVAHQIYRIQLGVIQLAAPRMRTLKIYGGDLVRGVEGVSDGVLDQIFGTLRRLSAAFDAIMFFELPVGGYLWKYLTLAGAPRHGFRLVERGRNASVVHYIRLPDTYQQYLSSFSGRRRKAWRKTLREFGAACPQGYEVKRITAPDDTEAFLRDVDAIFPSTWQARVLTRRHATLANIDYYRIAAHQGVLRCYVLRVDGKPIAFSSGFQCRGMYYFDETGYDVQWRANSPGTVLLLRMIEDLCAYDSPRECNFGFGAGLQKETFGNWQQAVRIVSLLPKDAVRGAVIVRSDVCVQWVYHKVKRVVTRLGIDRWVRDRLKRRGGADA